MQDNDPTPAQLEEVAQWLDSLYVRLQGVELMFSTPEGIEAYHGNFKREEYRASVQADIDRASSIGISMSRPMEHCGCLFEFLNGDELPPREIIMKARSEVNNLAVAIRQYANDCHVANEREVKADEARELVLTVSQIKNCFRTVDGKNLGDDRVSQIMKSATPVPKVKPKSYKLSDALAAFKDTKYSFDRSRLNLD